MKKLFLLCSLALIFTASSFASPQAGKHSKHHHKHHKHMMKHSKHHSHENKGHNKKDDK